MRQARVIVHRSKTEQAKAHAQWAWWQRVLLAGYSLVFALVLPLICWGAYAAPGHPHRTPHFVFVNSVADDASPATSDVHHHKATAPPAQTSEPATAEQPKGRATLSLMIFSVLTIVIVGAWVFSRVDRRFEIPLYLPPFAKSITLPIPLPPPRSALFARQYTTV